MLLARPRPTPATALPLLLALGGLALPLAAPSIASAWVRINEIQSDNATTIADEAGEFEDWVEIINTGPSPVDLEGYGLSDDPEDPMSWTFPAGTILPAGEVLLVWADKDVDAPGLHADFKIDKDGEEIVLAEPCQLIIDAAPPLVVGEDRSYGRRHDGFMEWLLLETPTPGAANATDGLRPPPAAPEVSVAGGFYAEAFLLTLSHVDPNVELRYTLDGSPPNAGSPLYSAPLLVESREGDPNTISLIPTGDARWREPRREVFKATVLRAAAFAPEAHPSEIVTHSYFIDPDVAARYAGISVVSLATHEDDFFGYDRGIYVPGRTFDENFEPGDNPLFVRGNYSLKGDEWERPVHIEIFDPEGNRRIAQDGGVRIHGDSTRVYPQKSLRLYGRPEYGDKDIDYPFFGPDYADEFERILLRNGGQNFFGWRLADALYHTMVAGAPVDTQAYSPVVVFLNGSYWGVHGARERFDEFYVERHYGVDPDDLVILTQDRVVWHGEEGDEDTWDELVAYMESHDLSVPVHYAWVEERMDLESFLHFLAINTITGKSDWVPRTGNERHWRKRTDGFVSDAPLGHDGRWRWVLKDTDRGFATGVNADLFTNRLAFWKPFTTLAANTGFRDAFINLIADYLNGRLSTEQQLAGLEAIVAEVDPWMPEHMLRWRWPSNYDFYNEKLDNVRAAIQNRPGIVRSQIPVFFGLAGSAELALDLSEASGGQVHVGTVAVDRQAETWTGVYFEGVPITLRAEPDPGQQFLGWFGEEFFSAEPELSIDPQAGLALTPRFGLPSPTTIGGGAQVPMMSGPALAAMTAALLGAGLFRLRRTLRIG